MAPAGAAAARSTPPARPCWPRSTWARATRRCCAPASAAPGAGAGESCYCSADARLSLGASADADRPRRLAEDLGPARAEVHLHAHELLAHVLEVKDRAIGRQAHVAVRGGKVAQERRRVENAILQQLARHVHEVGGAGAHLEVQRHVPTAAQPHVLEGHLHHDRLLWVGPRRDVRPAYARQSMANSIANSGDLPSSVSGGRTTTSTRRGAWPSASI